MRALITSDLHLTARRKDLYRWDLFPWLNRQIDRREITHVLCLGDITDQKDRHPASLVNRVLEEFASLRAEVIALKGNHDYINPDVPFMLHPLNLTPNVTFISEPTFLEIDGITIGCFPHEHGFSLRGFYAEHGDDLAEAALLLFHQTFKGAKASSGFTLDEGPSPKGLGKVFARMKSEPAVVSGDIHVPQRLGCIRYVGAPYPVRFGDDYQPRVLLWDSEDPREFTSINRSTIRKASLRITKVGELEDAKLSEGDMVKVTLTLPRHRFGEWQELRQEIREVIEENEAELHGLELKEAKKRGRLRLEEDAPQTASTIEPSELLKEFAETEKLSKDRAATGQKLLKEAGSW